jgi:hypothetical protein
MATTVPQAFERFRASLEITGLQESTVSTRQQNVRATLEAGMSVLDTFLTGITGGPTIEASQTIAQLASPR